MNIYCQVALIRLKYHLMQSHYTGKHSTLHIVPASNTAQYSLVVWCRCKQFYLDAIMHTYDDYYCREPLSAGNDVFIRQPMEILVEKELLCASEWKIGRERAAAQQCRHRQPPSATTMPHFSTHSQFDRMTMIRISPFAHFLSSPSPLPLVLLCAMQKSLQFLCFAYCCHAFYTLFRRITIAQCHLKRIWLNHSHHSFCDFTSSFARKTIRHGGFDIVGKCCAHSMLGLVKRYAEPINDIHTN